MHRDNLPRTELYDIKFNRDALLVVSKVILFSRPALEFAFSTKRRPDPWRYVLEAREVDQLEEALRAYRNAERNG